MRSNSSRSSSSRRGRSSGSRRSPSGRSSRSGSRRSSASSSRISSDSDIEERMSEIYDFLSQEYSEQFYELGYEPPEMIEYIDNLDLTDDEFDLLNQMIDDGWR